MSFSLVPSFPLLCDGGGGGPLAADSEYGLHSIDILSFPSLGGWEMLLGVFAKTLNLDCALLLSPPTRSRERNNPGCADISMYVLT